MKIFIFLYSLASFVSTYAADINVIPKDSKSNKDLVTAFKTWEFSFWDFANYIVYLIDILAIISVTVALVFVIVWGFKYTLAFWDDTKTWEAKNTVKNALLGLAIASLAWVIIELIIRLISS